MTRLVIHPNDRTDVRVVEVPQSWIPAAALHEEGASQERGHTSLVLPRRFHPLRELVDRLWHRHHGLARRLKAMNEARAERVESAVGWLMNIRALAGFTELLGNHSSVAAGVDSSLVEAAQRLANLLERNDSWTAQPMNHFDPRFERRRLELADEIYEHVAGRQSSTYAELTAELMNSDVGEGTKQIFMIVLGNVLAESVFEVGKTNRHGEIARHCDVAVANSCSFLEQVAQRHPVFLEPDEPGESAEVRHRRKGRLRQVYLDVEWPDDVGFLEGVNIVRGVASKTIGGKNTLHMAATAVAVPWILFGQGRSGDQRGTLPPWVTRYFWGFDRLTDAERTTLRTAIEEGEDAAVREARTLLRRSFTRPRAFRLAACALKGIQFGYIVYTASTQDGGWTWRDGLDASTAGASLTSSVYTTIYTWRNAGQVVRLERGATLSTGRQVYEVMSGVGSSLSVMTSVVTIMDGVNLMAEGEDEQRFMTQAIGAVTAASGIALAVAVLCDITGAAGAASVAGPVGTVLGLVAGVMAAGVAIDSATDAPPYQVAMSLRDTIAGAETSEADNYLSDRAVRGHHYRETDVGRRLWREVERVCDYLTDRDYDSRRGHFRLTGPAEQQEIITQLRTLGFSEGDARRMSGTGDDGFCADTSGLQ